MRDLEIAVVGCGMFGAMTALKMVEKGFNVTIYDMNSKPLQGASLNNQNRLHLGFHYPRDEKTAIQCLKGFDSFIEEFQDSIMGDFDNAYFIAKDGSLTSPDDYLSFCDKLGLEYQIIDPKKFNPSVTNVDLGLLCKEVVYDSQILSSIIFEKFKKAGIKPEYNKEVIKAKKNGDIFELTTNDLSIASFDAVVNCSYADINRLNCQIASSNEIYQYEYTMVPIVSWNRDPVGITLMDGPFMTVLPFGKTGNFLLYHVDHTVIDRHMDYLMPDEWKNRETAPSSKISSSEVFNDIKNSFADFVPAVHDCEIQGFLQTTRVVLANKENTDARPSIIKEITPGFMSVFTGKIDHCTWVAEDITKTLSAYLGKN